MARKLSDAEKLTADWIAKETRTYGSLTKEQVSQLADTQRAQRGQAHQMLAHGLTAIASEMEPGEVVTGSVPWWKRL